MSTRENLLVGSTVLLVLALWSGYLVHQSPRFPGSLVGGVLGILAAVLMLVPLAYVLVKRWPAKAASPRRARLRARMLELHVYASLAGAVLAIVHSGHRFESALGIALMSAMLISVGSGFVGRHFLRYVSDEMRGQQALLAELHAEFATRSSAEAAMPAEGASGEGAFFQRRGSGTWRLATAIADVEYAIAMEQAIKRKLSWWLGVHIAASVAFYALLIFHVWASLQFGLRWLG